MLLCLLIGLAYIKKIDHDDVSFCYSRDMYLLFVPHLLLKKALDRLDRYHHTILIPNEIDYLVKISSASLFQVMHKALLSIKSEYPI